MKKAIILLLVLALLSCDQSTNTDTEVVSETAYSKIGVVLESIDVETYTYVRLDIEGREYWIASNPVWVSKGDLIRFSDAIFMENFHSESLNRTFSEIYFVNNVELVESGGSDTSTEQKAPASTSNPHANMGIDPISVATAVDVRALEGGITIADVYAEREQLEGQKVSLRAKVIKFSPNILGRNWITCLKMSWMNYWQ